LFLSCDKEIAKQRFLTRKLPGRLDDDVDMFERRYREFELLNKEIMAYYQTLGRLVQVRLAT
jgi:adenylate kinase family enzyme